MSLPLFSSSGSRYRPTWRPRREALNIDSIFTRPRGSSLGYNTLPAPSLPSEAQDPVPAEGAAPPPQLGVQELDRWDLEAGSGLVGPPRSFGSGRTMGPPAPPPLRRVEQQPRLIQRMESGYESSERNSSSPDRWGGAVEPSTLLQVQPTHACLCPLPQGGGPTQAGADVGPFLAFGAQVEEQRRHPAGAALSGLGAGHQRRCVV